MDYSLVRWDEVEYIKFVNELEKIWEVKEKYSFNTNIGLKVLGIRTPVLKSVAKSIAKGEWKNFLKESDLKYYEELEIKGLVIGYIKADKEIIKEYVEIFYILLYKVF